MESFTGSANWFTKVAKNANVGQPSSNKELPAAIFATDFRGAARSR
jgi:hypothetical protein